MSGKKRASPARGRPQAATGAQEASGHEVSNQSLLDQLGEGAGKTERPGGTDAVRAVAVPLVERGLFAVHAEPRPAETLAHYVDVLETSRLPSERRAALVDKLIGDQESAVAAKEAVQRHFGSANDSGEDLALDVLGSVFAGLQRDPPELTGSVGDRADAWIADLAGEHAAAVQAFCREVHFILGFEEEEDETTLLDMELEG